MSEAGVGLILPKGERESLILLIEGLRAEVQRITELQREAAKQVEQKDNIIAELLYRGGEPGSCTHCNQPIVWLMRQERQPFDHNGLSHLKTCPLRRLK